VILVSLEISELLPKPWSSRYSRR